MHALIVFESMYGNTRAIAEAVACGLSDRYEVRLATPDEAPGTRAAAFDTRLGRPAWLTGSAARGIARRLRARGFEVVAGFVVHDAEGPLAEHEKARARAWAALPREVPAHV